MGRPALSGGYGGQRGGQLIRRMPAHTDGEPVKTTSTRTSFLFSIARPIPRFSVVVLAVPPFLVYDGDCGSFAINTHQAGEPRESRGSSCSRQ